MNAMTHWNPFKEMDELSNRLSTLWGASPDRFNGGASTEWAPRVDIVEDDNEFLIKADLPAVDRKDVKVTVENGVLTVSGERKSEKKEDDGKTWHRVERVYGSFTRSFTLPENVDASKVTARFNNGELEIHVPKVEEVRPRPIEVKVG